jgi:CheY-like chemotaxis protein
MAGSSTFEHLAGTILVVDDHVDLAENLAEILESAGYGVAVADSAESALARIEAGGIAALITDYRLPGRSGAELITELRRRGNTIPAVLMSAYTDPGTIEAGRAAGALDVLAKPVGIPKLIEVVATLAREDTDVFIVDDNVAFAENLAEIMRGRGLRPIVGASAEEVLAQRTRPRAAVLDFRLPDRSGSDLADRLVARDPRVRILFVTAYPDDLPAKATAGRDVLAKPVDMDRLLAWLAQAVGPR